MGTVLHFTVSSSASRQSRTTGEACEVVIFPGVRIERHDAGADIDLGFRLRDGDGDFDGMGGGRRPRKTS